MDEIADYICINLFSSGQLLPCYLTLHTSLPGGSCIDTISLRHTCKTNKIIRNDVMRRKMHYGSILSTPLDLRVFCFNQNPPTHNQRYENTPEVLLTFIGNLTGISQEWVTDK